MSELAELQSTLTRILREALPVSSSWENLKAVKNLQEINQKLDGVSSAPPSASIVQTITAFRRSQRVENRDLKYVCYGAAMQMQDGWCVLGDDELLNKLLAGVEHQNEARKRLRCFQALLSSYFSFARYDEQTIKAAHAGWEILRDWLAQQIAQFKHDGVNKKIRLPDWFTTLAQHENLLTNKPCDRYGEDMLRGDNSSIEVARQGLGIPGDSWVMQEVILSQMRASVALGDDPFKTSLDTLLRLVLGQTEVKVSDLLKLRAIALLISRYARCVSKPEQPVLRDAAVSIIGNPWLKRTSWDTWVNNRDGQPDDEAREMVNGWLTRQLITDFFELLSADGQADQRRLNYWLRFVPVIEGTPWLALGPDAWRNMTQPYRELRERAKGCLLRLVNPGSSGNNAFIMKMNDWLVVEFGMTGHACYVYPATPMPFSLGDAAISLHDLKDRNRADWLTHNDGNVSWEGKFDEAICPKVGLPAATASRPNTKPSTAHTSSHNLLYVEQYVKKFSIQSENDRANGGAFWVLTQKGKNPTVDWMLESWGFKYKENRGWWKL
jgi:hypothetical protein